MKFQEIAASIILSLLFAVGCGEPGSTSDATFRTAMDGVDADVIESHMEVLAADEMQGRGTGSVGYLAAARYVADRMAEFGVQPLGGHDSYYQQVSLLATRIDLERVDAEMTRASERRALEWGVDYLASPDCLRLGAEVDAKIHFVGFGVRAEDQAYDDYADIDVTGKLVAMFSGAPETFPPTIRAFHSLRSNKRRHAAEVGAIGILWMQTPADRSKSNWSRSVEHSRMESMCRVSEEGAPLGVEDELLVQIQLSESGEDLLFDTMTGGLKTRAKRVLAGEAASVELPGRLRLRAGSIHRRLESPNVVGYVRGSDERLAEEYVVVSAHLDHVGTAEDGEGDRIYNGAYDNASGVSMLLESARVWAESPTPPRRSVIFLATTGEEKGLLGAKHFAERPTVPDGSIVANINMDMALMFGTPNDVVVFGAEHSSLGDNARIAAEAAGLRLAEDPIPDEVFFIRSDQYPFIEEGIPSVFVFSGMDQGEGVEPGLEAFRDWMRDTYHTPADDMNQPIRFETGARFAQVGLAIAWQVAQGEGRPSWNEGDFFGNRFGAH